MLRGITDEFHWFFGMPMSCLTKLPWFLWPTCYLVIFSFMSSVRSRTIYFGFGEWKYVDVSP